MKKLRSRIGGGLKTMISKYPGTCSACGKPIHRGELIQYFGRGRGIEHAHECREQGPRTPDAPCWICKAPEGYFRNLGAATPVWCDGCHAAEIAKTQLVGNVRVARDNSSAEDSICGDLAYEDRCAEACGGGL